MNSCEEIAFQREHAHPGPDVRHGRVDREMAGQFADEDASTVPAVDVNRAGPVEVVDLRLVVSLRVEHLDAMVLPVRHVHEALGVRGDVVGDVEAPRIGARLAP
jgi:hypothetical protein